MTYSVSGLPTPVPAVQLLYRSTNARGEAVANVTSILKPLTGVDPSRAVAYNSFYDSLNPEDSPSRSIAGNVSLGGVINTAEALFVKPLLLAGYTVVVADTQGPTANFAAGLGPEYGRMTLDSIRAATRSSATGLTSSTRFGMLGYSGGAIATNWAAALAPSYAPEVNARLVGAASGGLLVKPSTNLKYVSGSLVWAGIAPLALTGLARAYDFDIKKYTNSYGASLVDKMQDASIVNVLGQYPGLTYQQILKPAYANPNSIPEYVEFANQVNLGQQATPTIPLYVAQGVGGFTEGTLPKAGIGGGDGVMVAGDVRSLLRQCCATGNSKVSYTQYDLLSHTVATATWAPVGIAWLNERFAGRTAPSSCGWIAAGNSLAPEVLVPPAS
ncbi:lipase family protein [Knoellia subterranea]|uniref:lipase family protein n=1 Tax=Knoellia subterranea TaxID=184882 RepID=UPI00146FE4D7|nr:lipase family protein [Knoellia subterranea]